MRRRFHSLRIGRIPVALAALALILGGGILLSGSQSALAAVTASQAEQAALQAVPGTIVQPAQLEDEDGTQVYGVIVQASDGSGLWDVKVSADSGQVLKKEPDDRENGNEHDGDED